MDSDSLVLTYCVTREEFQAALKLWRRTGVHRSVFLARIGRWTLIAMALLPIVALGIEALLGATRQLHASLLTFAPLFIVIATFFASSRLSRGKFRSSRLGEPAMLEAREDELRYQLQDGSLKVQYSWSAILKAVENSEVFVIMTGERSILIVPKAQIAADALRRLAEIVRQHDIPLEPL